MQHFLRFYRLTSDDGPPYRSAGMCKLEWIEISQPYYTYGEVRTHPEHDYTYALKLFRVSNNLLQKKIVSALLSYFKHNYKVFMHFYQFIEDSEDFIEDLIYRRKVCPSVFL